MAMWIGAVMKRHPTRQMTHGFAGPIGCAAFLQVNLKGERFQNEDVPGQSYTNAVERQPGRTASAEYSIPNMNGRSLRWASATAKFWR